MRGLDSCPRNHDYTLDLNCQLEDRLDVLSEEHQKAVLEFKVAEDQFEKAVRAAGTGMAT